MSTISRTMTEQEFLELPDVEGLERELIGGELREKVVTTRAYAHCLVTSNISYLLNVWLLQQPAPYGDVICGEARIRLRRDPLTFVGVDVAYIAPESRPDRPSKAGYFDGPPVLVVEVLSPSDPQEDIHDKIDEYLDAGVMIVWVVDPRRRTVMVVRPDSQPEFFNTNRVIFADPELPGFEAPVSAFFRGLDD